ncbi:TPA: phage holin family protein [Klebsiella pneumoniae]|nr:MULTISPECIES: phage holin family protein [Klebsiella]HBR2034574.1 phage holin family protein [Klebsiella quasipneumoniae subsp. quasipneumoniae]HCB0227167.1 phage holin family protein [Klebsiella variicola subsp. variicola]AUB46712.1 Phage holin [Klebsiella pneumoniae]AYO66772.1 phage holin family protein [Klebsiella pneumoniae]MBD1314626.1 phage holin family protein [Klebsiella pneumoniae]
MTGHDLLLIADSISGAGIALRVMFFQRNGSRHRRWGGWIAYFLIVAAASIPLRTAYSYLYHFPMTADLSEVVINAVMFAAVLKTRGNVVQIFKISRSQHGH